MMVPLRILRVTFCSSKRKWITLFVVVVFLIFSLFIAGHQSRLVTYFFGRTLATRYTSIELEAMIPLEDDSKAVLLHARKSNLERVVMKQSNLTSFNLHLDSLLDDSDPLLPKTGRCRPVDPKVLFFVRIPKCASTSFVELLKVWSKREQFELFFHPSGAYDWDIGTIKKVAGLVNSKKSRRFVYARHFYYTNFRMYGVEDYTYLTIIRDPVSRFLSSYLYYHFSSRPHIQAILNPAHKNETLLDCIEHQHEGCAHNWLTKYFCGHNHFCKLGNEQALKTAKENILRDYSAIGLMEEMDQSMALFHTLLPGYFSFGQEDQLPQSNKNEQTLQMSRQEEEAIRSANQADIQLYSFVRTLFHKTIKACKLN